MKRKIVSFVVAAMMLSGLFACANMQPKEKVLVCQEVLRLVQPECLRLEKTGEEYVSLCLNVVEDAITACEAGIMKDASAACPIIAAKAELSDFIPDDSPQREANVALCKRVISASSLVCTLALSRHDNNQGEN